MKRRAALYGGYSLSCLTMQRVFSRAVEATACRYQQYRRPRPVGEKPFGLNRTPQGAMGIESLAEGGMKARERTEIEGDRRDIALQTVPRRRRSAPEPVRVGESASVTQTSCVERIVRWAGEEEAWIKTGGNEAAFMRCPPEPALKLKRAASLSQPCGPHGSGGSHAETSRSTSRRDHDNPACLAAWGAKQRVHRAAFDTGPACPDGRCWRETHSGGCAGNRAEAHASGSGG